MPSRTVLAVSAVAAFLVTGTAVALLVSDDLRAAVAAPELWIASERGHARCDDVDGRLLEASAEERSAGDVRVLRYTLDPAALDGGEIEVCDGVGDVLVGPSDDERVHVTITVRPSDDGTAEHVAAADVGAAFADDGGALDLVAWYVGPNDGDGEVSVDITVLVPATGAWEVDAVVGVGDVLVTDLLVDAVDARSGVGEVAILGTDATGDVVAESGVGDVSVKLASVETSSVSAQSGVGEVAVLVPSRPDIGYEATAQTGVGSADVAIGPAEEERRDGGERGPGGSAYSRSKDFASKPTQVRVTVQAGTGDVSIVAV